MSVCMYKITNKEITKVALCNFDEFMIHCSSCQEGKQYFVGISREIDPIKDAILAVSL